MAMGGTEHNAQSGGRGLLLCYYGDDFTGSTDVLEALAQAGLRTVLFLQPPTEALLRSRFSGIQCFGIAGVGRSLSPEEMDRELRPIFATMKSSGAAVAHYKVCSTFDSSPLTGSIGKAAEIGRDVFGGRYIPLLAGVPYLRRYTLFGQHFAAAGDQVYRLDRHPTMSRHPVTPMDEADLLAHLRKQTAMPSALLDIVALTGGDAQAQGRLARLLETERPQLVLFDVLDEPRLETAGRLIWAAAQERQAEGAAGSEGAASTGETAGAGGASEVARDSGAHGQAASKQAEACAAVSGGEAREPGAAKSTALEAAESAEADEAACEGAAAARRSKAASPLFVVGSSGVEYALTAAWRAAGLQREAAEPLPPARPVDRLLVLSGSCSPVTERQIARALAAGFVGIRVPAVEWATPEQATASEARVAEEARSALRAGRSVLVYSASGPGDDSIGLLREALAARGRKPEDSSRLLGAALGRLARELVAAEGLTRLLIAGGDTSGYITRELGVYALECCAALAPGAPLCRAYAHDARFDGLELVLKGGQIGGEAFFEAVRG